MIATRTRPYSSPIPTSRIQQHAIELRDEHFETRTRRIAELAASSADTNDIMYWSMVYDTTEAPNSTSRARLLEYGIIPVPPHELTTSLDVHDELWTIIEALAKAGMFLFHTNHLSDSDLYARLYYKILDEPTRMLPPASVCAEFIDCLHPLDQEHPSAQRIYPDPTLQPSNSFYDEAVPAYIRGPVFTLTGPNVRDTYLPTPAHAL